MNVNEIPQNFPVPAPKTGVDRPALQKGVEEFESFFLYFMLKVMRESVPQTSLFGGGPAQEIYTSLFDEEISKAMAVRGGLGLSDLLLKELSSPIPSEGGSRRRESLREAAGPDESSRVNVKPKKNP
jgi:flagellar protein FlgJ